MFEIWRLFDEEVIFSLNGGSDTREIADVISEVDIFDGSLRGSSNKIKAIVWFLFYTYFSIFAMVAIMAAMEAVPEMSEMDSAADIFDIDF